MFSALSFLTIFGRSTAPNAGTLAWFAPAGALIGLLVALTHEGAHRVWPLWIAGAMVLVVDLLITGALHVDGLADSSDGLLPHMERSRRLTVMSEPTVGVFAVVVVALAMLVRWSVFSHPNLDWAPLVLIWAMSRALAAAAPAFMQYARPEGLATAFLPGASRWLLAWVVPLGAALIALEGTYGILAVEAGIIGAGAVALLARMRIGGFTGDVLGAMIVVGETCALAALAAQF